MVPFKYTGIPSLSNRGLVWFIQPVCWTVWLLDSVPPEEWQIWVYLMKSTLKFGQTDTSLKTLFQNVHIYMLVSPKKGMMETFLWLPALHCWISETQPCITFHFLGFLNAMSIFLCFLNSSKNKNTFNVCFLETVFLNSLSVCCTYIEEILQSWKMLYLVLSRGIHGYRRNLYKHHSLAAFQGICLRQIPVANCWKSTGMLYFFFIIIF